MSISPQPLVSIITVVFNSEKFLEGTVRSIEAQNIKNYEYIIIDGGSTDGTLEIIKIYSAVISKWISEPDKGLYDAMNKGLKLAGGKYVWFVNSGDKLYNAETLNMIEEVCDKENEPDVIFGETIIIDENDNEIGSRRLKTPETLTWRSLIDGLVVCHQSFIVKKNTAPFYDTKYKIASDYDWILKCLKNSDRIVNSRLVLSRYLDNGLSKNNIIKALKERFLIMTMNFGFFNTAANHILIGLRFFYYLIRHKRF